MDIPNPDLLKILQESATKAAEPEKKPIGPGDVGPSMNDKAGQLVTLQMSKEEVDEWWKEINRATERIKKREGEWDLLLNEYQPIVSKSGDPETVKYNGHFRNVCSKIGQLFYTTPELVLSPKDPGPANNQIPNPLAATPQGQAMLQSGQPIPPLRMEDVVSIKQAVLKDKLGLDGIDAERLMDELLFDVLAWAGIGCYKIGYRCVTRDMPKMVPDPTYFQPGQAAGVTTLGISPAAQQAPMVPSPLGETEPVPIFEEWYGRRFSPKKVLYNSDLKSTRFREDATYMGMHFYMTPKRAQKVFKLTEEQTSKATSDDRVHKWEKYDTAEDGQGLVHGVELWPKASFYREEEVHPQAIDQLILIEGLEQPVVYRPSPDQTFNDRGRLTDDSLSSFPIGILTIRDLADSPSPSSDAAFANSNIKQRGTWLRQSVAMRDAAIGKYVFDGGEFDSDDIDAIKNAPVGDWVRVKAGSLTNGVERIMGRTPQIQATQDDYRMAQILKQDNDETLGISANSAGSIEDTVRTATEIDTARTFGTARNKKEQARVINEWLHIVRGIDQLLMRYATELDYVTITGEFGAQVMQAWNNKLVSGRWLYDISPDSQMSINTSQDYNQLLQFYNLSAPDPLCNRAYLLRRLARMKGLDPNKAVLDPTQMQTMMQFPHGGGPANKHEAAKSGGMENAPGADNHRNLPGV